MEILVKNAALVKVLQEIGEVFAANYPADYERFINHVREESKNLLKPSGMSADGHMMNLMKIPCATNKAGLRISLYAIIRKIVRKHTGIDDFFRDRQNYYLLTKIWKDANVKRSPTAMLRVTPEDLNVHAQ